jgi:hypothetical protein
MNNIVLRLLPSTVCASPTGKSIIYYFGFGTVLNGPAVFYFHQYPGTCTMGTAPGDSLHITAHQHH